jgi:hypothetical protein
LKGATPNACKRTIKQREVTAKGIASVIHKTTAKPRQPITIFPSEVRGINSSPFCRGPGLGNKIMTVRTNTANKKHNALYFALSEYASSSGSVQHGFTLLINVPLCENTNFLYPLLTFCSSMYST